MFVPVTHFLPLTKIRRERLLPIPGRVLVHTGQKVIATDVIAETKLINQHMLLDISSILGINPKQVERILKVSVNQVVAEGDILAGPVGIIPRLVRAPQNGRIVHFNDGQLLFELETQPFQLRAGMEGVIKGLIAERGAILETTGALVQGVWGNGNIDQGTLNVLAQSPKDELTTEMLNTEMRGAILLCGHITKSEALKALQHLYVRGLILASISANLVPLAAQCKFPVVVLDGFGRIPMNSMAFKILSTNAGREIAVNANGWERYSDSRPEVIIPLPATSDVDIPKAAEMLASGQKVRISTNLIDGSIGKIIALRTEQASLNNGLRVPAAMIHLENGENTIVPLANLEQLA
jgi:hypothetical protein